MRSRRDQRRSSMHVVACVRRLCQATTCLAVRTKGEPEVPPLYSRYGRSDDDTSSAGLLVINPVPPCLRAVGIYDS